MVANDVRGSATTSDDRHYGQGRPDVITTDQFKYALGDGGSMMGMSAAFSDGRQRSQMVGSVLRWSAAFSEGRPAHQENHLDDVASPGWAWHPRDERGIPETDMASPGWTWHRWDRHSLFGMDMTMSRWTISR